MAAASGIDSSAPLSARSHSDPQTNRAGRLGRVSELVERQAGVLGRRQLVRLGWTENQIDHELRFDRWQSPVPGLVVLNTGTLSALQRQWIGVLHAGPGAVLTHLTAAEAAGLRWVGHDVIEILTPKGDLVAPIPGYFFHQTRRPYQQWVKPAPGPPRLPVEHAVLLAAERDKSVRRAIGLLATSVQQRLTTCPRLVRVVPQINKLRHGKTFRLVLDDIAGGAQSFAELDVGQMCREAGIEEPVRQVVRVDKQGRRRYLDCTWVLADGRTLVLEIDGSFHAEVVAWWQDMPRERAVVISGSTVLRCSTIELRLERSDILADLVAMGVPRLPPRFVHAASA
jgi:hypothetical protein